jgi:hypothetical protein
MPKPKTRLQQQPTAPPPAPVDIRQLPVVNCALCDHPLPHQPGRAQDVLTQHYNDVHLDELTVAVPASR